MPRPRAIPKSLIETHQLEALDPNNPMVQAALSFRSKLLTERGGEGRLSALEVASVRTVAVLTCVIDAMLSKAVNGDKVDWGVLNSLIATRRKEVEVIGVKPPPLDVTPSLAKYLELKRSETAD